MTIVVAVLCEDGVVVGTDSIATSTSGIVPIMQIASNDKIRIFDSCIIVASTGAVGYAQRLHVHVQEAVNDRVFRQMEKRRCIGNIADRFLRDLQSTQAQNHPQHGIGFGAVMACVIRNEICLIEYSTNNFQPEYKEGKLFYVSMGSGQPLADPFLAFVSRVLWKGQKPDLLQGKLGVQWALTHTISLAPGTVGPPLKIATLRRDADKWVAEMAGEMEIQESEQYIARIEQRIGDHSNAALKEENNEPMPTVGSDRTESSGA